MDRQGSLVTRRASWVAMLLAVLASSSAAAPSRAEDPPAEPAKSVPIDRQPYRIKAVFAVDPASRLDDAMRGQLWSDWEALIKRFVGAPWRVEIARDDPLGSSAADPASLQPEPIAAGAVGWDKVWLIAIRPEGSGLLYVGREFDVATGRLGPLQQHSVPVARDAARGLFLFSQELFSPYAEIGDRFAQEVAIIVRGASLPSADPVGNVVTKGTVFQPMRIVPRKDGPPLVREIPFTFLRAEAVDGRGARCSVVSVYGDPFTRRVVQKTSLVALGVKAGKSPTRLRFQTTPHRAPAAGYVLSLRNYPDGVSRDVGTTDREGRITLDPIVADRLVIVRLVAGSSEPMIEFPMMPGESAEERLIPAFDPKPLTVALETKLDSMRDAVIDLVAVRARLQARLQARFDGEDWAGAEEALAEFRKLTPRERLADELARLKEDAARQQAETKQAILTKNAQAQIAELQNLIDRYLDDEAFKALAEALAQAKAVPVKKEATPAKGVNP